MALLTNQPARLNWSDLHQQPDRDHRGARLLQALENADLRGRGGAGFPTATKIRSSLGSRPMLIVNVCDGEPLVSKDAVLVSRSPGLLIDGVALVAAATQAREVVFAVHADTPTEAALRALLGREGQLLPPSRVMAVPARYVSSEESSLASRAMDGEARPRFRSVPLTHGGVGGSPVLVLNAETCAQVAVIWSAGPPRAQLHRLITASGAVRRPGVLDVDDRFQLAELARPGFGEPQAVLLGGYGGTWLPWSTARQHTIASLAQSGVPLGAGLVYLIADECPVAVVGVILRYLAGESAGQCGPCMFGLPAVATDWVQLLDPAKAAAARQRLARRLPVISGRGACRHPDGAVRQAASALSVFARHIDFHLSGQCVRPSVAAAAAPCLAGAW
jgi:NADH:ubiquinone oxidoreductase subunit F (NADH-binding)